MVIYGIIWYLDTAHMVCEGMALMWDQAAKILDGDVSVFNILCSGSLLVSVSVICLNG